MQREQAHEFEGLLELFAEDNPGVERYAQQLRRCDTLVAKEAPLPSLDFRRRAGALNLDGETAEDVHFVVRIRPFDLTGVQLLVSVGTQCRQQEESRNGRLRPPS